MNSIRSIGLTGGIACGKSTVEGMVAERGWPVLDADEVAHELLKPESPVFLQILTTFGDRILNDEGGIDRGILGKLVFSNPEKLQELNALMHPEIKRRCQSWMQEALGMAPVAVVSVPLLFELGWEEQFDHVVCVAATSEHVFEQLKTRGLSQREAEQRIAAQLPVDIKESRADAVIRNDGSLDDLRRNVEHWMFSVASQETEHGG